MGFVPDPTKQVYGEWTFGYLDGYQAWLQKGDPSNTLDLDFTTGGPLDSRVTFTRSSTGTFVGSNGLVQTAAINAPRFEYNSVTLQPIGLLIEDSRTNFIIWSEDYTQATWGKVGSTVGPNAIAAPDGATTADSVIDDATVATHTITKAFTPAVTGYVFSIWMKKATKRYAALQISGAGIVTSVYVSIDFDSNGALFLGQGAPTQYNVQAFLNGWYRVQIAFTTVDTTQLNMSVHGASGPLFADRQYTGTGVAVVYAWGAQLESGPYATSYVPTTTVSVSRSSDDAKITGTNFTSFHNPVEGTYVVYYDTVQGSAVTAPHALSVNDGTGANGIQVRSLQANMDLGVIQPAGNHTRTYGIAQYGIPMRSAVAYKVSDQALSHNGATPVPTGIIAAVPTLTQIMIGMKWDTSSRLNGHIRSLDYYNVRKDNAFLQAATAYPTSYYSLDFMTGVMPEAVTFTRSTIGTYVGSNGLIQTAAINTPRFGYHPDTLQMMGYLSEVASTNLALWSEDLTQSSWVKVGSTISGETVLAPDGTLSGDSLVENMAAASAHNVSQVFTPAATTVYTWSAFLKRSSSKQWASLIISGGGIVTNQCAVIDFDAGTITTVNGSPTAIKLTKYQGGWYRAELTFTTVSTAALTCYVYGMGGPAYANRLYDGFGTTAVYVWGAQLEALPIAVATSYIKTTNATVLRATDTATITGANFTSWFNPLEGTLVAEYFPTSITSATNRVFCVGDGTGTNRIESYALTANILTVDVASVNVVGLPGGIITANVVNKAAVAYKLNDFASSANGGVAVVDIVGTVPVVNRLGIGNNSTATNALNGFIRKLSYMPVRVPVALLQTLST